MLFVNDPNTIIIFAFTIISRKDIKNIFDSAHTKQNSQNYMKISLLIVTDTER